ncbi:hypothetical protein Nos7524_3090 [Nostoc sp. PCC 7524]|uniref:hypothetical protein n=1 Tax=Nostoc sp. (strain ATCC 29411 / PCC 7524) TaxID=28072 RepID=UPI00029F4B31|nr:hypothetical protein [Nostoc sp. PCC 7524]AFY48893.1 hypothetical protein Nos7524_3090 [Nostoc sp. PCC 7524]
MEILIQLLLNLLIIYYCIVALINIFRYVRCEWQAFIYKWNRRPQGRVSHSYRTDPRNRYLQSDLLTLLKGDVPTAKRLLAQQRRKNPGQSDNWYLEKVIHDLERDRRRS